MKAAKSVITTACWGTLFALTVVSCLAQTITGVPGSPSATVTISGKQLPPPDPKFGGVIKVKATESKPWWNPTVVPPKGAPNVLLIMTDDCGFGAPGTFGGVVPTPALDRIANNGIRYTQFTECQSPLCAESEKIFFPKIWMYSPMTPTPTCASRSFCQLRTRKFQP